MREVWIVEGLRTPIGKFQGALSSIRPDDLAALVIRGLIDKRPGIEVDEVIFGCANQAGEDNRNVARMATLLAGLPFSVPAVTVNRLCASGLEAVIQAGRSIAVGDADLVIAGGVESMSRAPYSLPRGPIQPKMGNVTAWDTSLGWRYPNPNLEKQFPLEAMGETAENVAEKYDISREDQDQFSERSHRSALAAEQRGHLTEQILPIMADGKIISTDEGPRADTSFEKLSKLKAIFRKEGTVTAGNSSTLNDGSAALVLASSDAISKWNLVPKARWLGGVAAGVDPRFMGIGPIPAIERLLQKHRLTIDSIDAWEVNEAFAAQTLAVQRQLHIPSEKLNIHGGGIAIGHPLGCSGARILISLLNILPHTQGKYGIASLCVGVGQGVAGLIERVK